MESKFRLRPDGKWCIVLKADDDIFSDQHEDVIFSALGECNLKATYNTESEIVIEVGD